MELERLELESTCPEGCRINDTHNERRQEAQIHKRTGLGAFSLEMDSFKLI